MATRYEPLVDLTLTPEKMSIEPDAPRNRHYDPTPRQLVFLTAIRDLTPWKDQSPTFREVAAALKVSTRTTAVHCEALRRKGLLRNDPELISVWRNLLLTDRGEEAVRLWLANPLSKGTRIGEPGSLAQERPKALRGVVTAMKTNTPPPRLAREDWFK